LWILFEKADWQLLAQTKVLPFFCYMKNSMENAFDCLIVGGGLGLTSLETIFRKKDETKDNTPTE
jgi:hypothetical protein